jgi:hypothetical protein
MIVLTNKIMELPGATTNMKETKESDSPSSYHPLMLPPPRTNIDDDSMNHDLDRDEIMMNSSLASISLPCSETLIRSLTTIDDSCTTDMLLENNPNKRSSPSTPEKRSGNKNTTNNRSSPPKAIIGVPRPKRRKYRRRNSILIRKDEMKEWSRTMFMSTEDDQQEFDYNHNHQSSPELFAFSTKEQDQQQQQDNCPIINYGNTSDDEGRSNRRYQNNITDFNASWADSDDTRRFMEAMSLDSFSDRLHNSNGRRSSPSVTGTGDCSSTTTLTTASLNSSTITSDCSWKGGDTSTFSFNESTTTTTSTSTSKGSVM